MEEIKNVSISVNLNEGAVSIAGSEQFVEKNMDKVFTFVEKVLGRNTTKISQKLSEKEKVEQSIQIEEKREVSTEDKYITAGVYHVDAEDGQISILKKIPGGSKSEKAKNIALIVLYIRKSKILGKEIIPICEKHNCYDSSNFSAIFKNEKANIIRKGNGQNWTIELTQPGEEAAVELLEGMLNDKK